MRKLLVFEILFYIMPSSPRRSTAKSLILTLLLFFPPAAWYLMSREKKYHSWFPPMLLLSVLLPLALLLIMALFVVPQLSQLSTNLNVDNPNKPYTYPIILSGITLLLAQAFFALYVRDQIKKNGYLKRKLLIISVLLLVVTYIGSTFASTAIGLSTVYSIYSLLNTM